MAGELHDFEQAERAAQASRGAPSARSGGYISFADMFDGGGAGRHGARFEGGGILSDFANMVATPRKSRGADTGQIRPVARPSVADINAARARNNAPYSLGRDLFDGGGLGRRATLAEINAGRGFRGGLLSNLANMFGVRPMGSNDLSLVASYDAALASRPDIVQQQSLLDPVAVEQSEDDVSINPIPAPIPVTTKPLGPPFLDAIRTSLNQPEASLDYEMPAGLLGQVQGQAAVIETTAKQLYDNDFYFMSMDQAREVAKDPVALKAYRDGKR